MQFAFLLIHVGTRHSAVAQTKLGGMDRRFALLEQLMFNFRVYPFIALLSRSLELAIQKKDI